MSRISKTVKSTPKDAVTNFMGGISYTMTPLTTLKMLTASSIFGDPQYYRNGGGESEYNINKLMYEYVVLGKDFTGLTASQIMEKVIDDALTFDFLATLEWAAELRTRFYMRLNPQVIMVRAAIHEGRKSFTTAHPKKFAEIEDIVMSRADEPAAQLAYYLFAHEMKKNNLPSVLKRAWARRIERMTRYEMYKYRNHEIGLIDTIRVCHANSADIDELMRTGTIEIPDESATWERLRSDGLSWAQILDTIQFPHMALLRNLRGIFSETDDLELCKKLMEQLKDGVLKGKQFPFRYYSALNAVQDVEVNHKTLITDTLEECIDIARANMPKLKGRTMCLSDNSGSAWGTINSEYGSVTVAEIDNLSSVITAQNSDEGFVGKFGDILRIMPISKRRGTLEQAQEISKHQCEDIGGGTENGVWIFFKEAIEQRQHWDNIFIYSDMQAGHGGLYGTDPNDYKAFATGRYIDVAKLIVEYRKQVNPHVNVFSVQTAGYDNAVVPEYAYRTNILYGWTGKELEFAAEMIKLWDEAESQA